MTVIAYGSAIHVALDAAEELGESIEVLDLRTLCPLDTEAILASARKTGKVLVAHEATRSCGSARRSRRSSAPRPSRIWTRRSVGSPRPTCRSRSAHRWNRPSFPSSRT